VERVSALATARHMFIFIVLLTALVLVTPTVISTSPIGCEWYNISVLRCWNNGTIENTTYYSLTDVGVQMANRDVSRFDWTTYRMGIHYRADNGSHVLIDFNEEGLLNGTYTKRLRTDNLTYYQINVSAYINRGNLSAYMEYTIGQLLNDDYVNFTFRVSTISGFTAFNKTLSFWRAMKNINVDLDDDVDIINGVINNGTIIGRFLNFTTPVWANNTGRFIQVGDKDSSHGIKWFWNDAKERIMYVTPQEGNPNNEVYWLRNTSTKIFDGRSYQLSEFWIDIDPCVISMVGT
jgi:hypothetical protein